MKVIVSSNFKSRLILTLTLFGIFTVLIVGIRLVSFNAVLDTLSGVEEEYTVIIDPGHGGVDGGTQAADGTLEKDINLQIALKVSDILKSFGVNTVMTRTDDRSIHDEGMTTIRQQKVSDIKNRLKIIENTVNPLFVSIHQNYYTNPKFFGTQVFYSKNNSQSSVLAECIRKSIVDNLQPDNKRENKQSGKEIYLLYHSKAPSVMVECGFLSNYDETEKLKSSDYQQKTAFLIALGVYDYIKEQSVKAIPKN